MSARKLRSKGSAVSKRQKGTSTAAVGCVNKKAKTGAAQATEAHMFNTNVKPVLEADIRAIRDAAGPLNGRTLGAQARSILLCVVYILQLAWRGTVTEAVVGAAAYLGVSTSNTLFPLVKHWQAKREVKAPTVEKQGRASNKYPVKANILESKHLMFIEEYIRDQFAKVEKFGVHHIRNQLKHKFGLSISKRQLRRTLISMGYKWGRKVRKGKKWLKREQHVERMKLTSMLTPMKRIVSLTVTKKVAMTSLTQTTTNDEINKYMINKRIYSHL